MTAPGELWLSVLDSRFRVSSDDERMLDLMRELWGPFAVDGPLDEPHEVTITRHDGGWRLDARPAPPITALDPWIVVASARNGISRNAIAEARSVPLHAAAVERDGTFVALAGRPEAGKTTLLLDLLERGWLLVTDDLVPLDPESAIATPFPKPLSVRDPHRWRKVAESWRVPEWLPAPVKVGLVPAAAVPVTKARTFAVSVVVFPRYEGGAGRLFEPLTRAQTLARSGENLHPHGLETAAALPALARMGAAGYVIRYGSSEDAVDLVEKCLVQSESME